MSGGSITETTIVLGVYPDPEQPGGVGFYSIKGARELQVVTATGQAERFWCNAIPGIDVEQAVVARKVWGDWVAPAARTSKSSANGCRHKPGRPGRLKREMDEVLKKSELAKRCDMLLDAMQGGQ